MVCGGALAQNEFVTKTQLCVIFLTTFLSRQLVPKEISNYLLGLKGLILLEHLKLVSQSCDDSFESMALSHIYLRCYSTNMLTIWLSILLLSFLIFMSNVSVINVFNHIFVSEVILKTRIIKTKHTITTFNQI